MNHSLNWIRHQVMPFTNSSVTEIAQFINLASRSFSMFGNNVTLKWDPSLIHYYLDNDTICIMFYGDNQPIGFIAGKKKIFRMGLSGYKPVLSIYLTFAQVQDNLRFSLLQHMKSVLVSECYKIYGSSVDYVYAATMNGSLFPGGEYEVKRLLCRVLNGDLLGKTSIVKKVYSTFSYPIWYDGGWKIRLLTKNMIDETLVEFVSELVASNARSNDFLFAFHCRNEIRRILVADCFKNFLVYNEAADETYFFSFMSTTAVKLDREWRVGVLNMHTFQKRTFSYVDGVMEWLCSWMHKWDIYDIVAMAEMHHPSFCRISKFVPTSASINFQFNNFEPVCSNGLTIFQCCH